MALRLPSKSKPGPTGAALLDRILAPDNLADAWDAVAENAGVPGVDREGIRRFRRNWEARLAALAAAVRGNRYRPARLRTVFIPKPSGGRRRISIPTVTDRVLQRAALQVLLPRLDKKFLGCSYGYRPGRGVAQAAAQVIRYRDRGLTWLLEADIDDCFGSLDHGILIDRLRREVGDERVMALMVAWLTVGLPTPPTADQPARGIALGMPISPLWANLYLHELDWQLVRNRWALVRYADDFIVQTTSPEAAAQARRVVAHALDGLKLQFEPSKTGVASFDDGFEFLGVRFKGDTYAFTWEEKRIVVKGGFDHLWGQYMTYDY